MMQETAAAFAATIVTRMGGDAVAGGSGRRAMLGD
jgi:hypothetical protein